MITVTTERPRQLLWLAHEDMINRQSLGEIKQISKQKQNRFEHTALDFTDSFYKLNIPISMFTEIQSFEEQL